MSEISKRLTTRQTELEKHSQAITKHAKSEQKKLASVTELCIRDVKASTKSAINSANRKRIFLPIFAIVLLLTIGLSAGIAGTLFIQNKTLATKHPDQRHLILCQEIGEINRQPVCLPQ